MSSATTDRVAVYLTIAALRRKLGTGTMNGTTALFGDGQWKVPSGGGGGQPSDANLTAFSDLDLIADRLIYASGTGTLGLTAFTSVARTLLGRATPALMRADLDLEPGVDVQAYHANLEALKGLTGANNKGFYFTGPGALSFFDLTIAGRALLDDADAGAQLTTLGFSTFAKTLIDDTTAGAVLTTLGISAFVQTLLDDADAAAVRATLGLVLGTNAQAFHANLTQLAGLSLIADRGIYANGTGTLSLFTQTSLARTLMGRATAALMRGDLSVAEILSGQTTDGVVAMGTIIPSGDDINGLIFKAPDGDWGADGESASPLDPAYATGQAWALHKEGSGIAADKVLARLNRAGGIGCAGLHVATGRNARDGYAPTQAVWINPYINTVGLVIHNPDTDVVVSDGDWTASWLSCVDVRPGSPLEVFAVRKDGVRIGHTSGLTVSGGWSALGGATLGICTFVAPPTTGTQGLVVRGQASHTADLIRAEDSAFVARFSVDPQGIVDAPNAGPSKTRYRLFDHFEAAGTQAASLGQIGGSAGFALLSGTAATVTQDGLTAGGAKGVATCSTGTTTTGYCAAAFLHEPNIFTAASTDIVVGARVRVTTLSTVGEQHEVRAGLCNTFNATAPTNGLYFRLQHGDTNWECVNARAAAETVTDSGVAAVAGTWVNLKVHYAAGGNATFYIDGTLVATQSANKPTDATGLYALAGIAKAAGSTARLLGIDLLNLDVNDDINVEQCLA